MSVLMRFDLQPERRTTEVQFFLSLHHQPISAVQGIGARRQPVQLRTPYFEPCDYDS